MRGEREEKTTNTQQHIYIYVTAHIGACRIQQVGFVYTHASSLFFNHSYGGKPSKHELPLNEQLTQLKMCELAWNVDVRVNNRVYVLSPSYSPSTSTSCDSVQLIHFFRIKGMWRKKKWNLFFYQSLVEYSKIFEWDIFVEEISWFLSILSISMEFEIEIWLSKMCDQNVEIGLNCAELNWAELCSARSAQAKLLLFNRRYKISVDRCY